MNLKFVSEYFLFLKMSDERIKWMENILGSYAGVKVNYDFRPVAYYYNLVFHAGRSGDSFVRKALVKITEARIWLFAGILLFLVPIFRFLSRRKDNFVLLAVMTTGFSEIVFQLLVMISFQIIYGFLFYKIGIILTSFMVGLAFGSFISVRNLHKMKNYFPVFIKTQAVICLYPLLLILFFGFFSVQKGNFFSYVGSNIFYPLIPVVAGFLGGFQLPLAGGILSGKWNTGKTAGKIYGADLLGSCVGAFIGGVVLIPVLGIYGTCWFASFINLIALIMLFSYNLSARQKREEI